MATSKKSKKPDVRSNAKLLMIETRKSDEPLRLFTAKKNHPYLIEFARTADARLVEVRVKQAEVMPLNRIAELFCANASQKEVTYEELCDLTPPKLPFRRSPPNAATTDDIRSAPQHRIQAEIRNLLLSGQCVTTKELYERFKQENLSDSTIRNYFRNVRQQLMAEHYAVLHVINKKGKPQRGKFMVML